MEFGETKKTPLQIIIDYKYIDIKYFGNFCPFTAQQRSFGKMMLYSCLSVHNGEEAAWIAGGGVHGGSMYGWEACVTGGRAHPEGTHDWGICVAWGIGATQVLPQYGWQAGGKHPTEMLTVEKCNHWKKNV